MLKEDDWLRAWIGGWAGEGSESIEQMWLGNVDGYDVWYRIGLQGSILQGVPTLAIM